MAPSVGKVTPDEAGTWSWSFKTTGRAGGERRTWPRPRRTAAWRRSRAAFKLVVNNVAPAVTAPADQSADEGAAKEWALGSFTDPGVNDGAWDVTVDWGDGASDSFSAAAQETPARGLMPTRRAALTPQGRASRDKDKDSGSASFKATVNNAAPVVTAGRPGRRRARAASDFDLGSFTDNGDPGRSP